MRLDLIVGAAISAVVTSPTARRVVRRGIVHGLAGLITVYDTVAKAAEAVVNEVSQEGQPKQNDQARAEASPEANRTPAGEFQPRALADGKLTR